MADHEMRLRMLGNAEVYVTCKCLESKRTGWKGSTTNNRRVKESPAWRSLGDFPVGTPIAELTAAYAKHLEG